jgi:hypothetical protein
MIPNYLERLINEGKAEFKSISTAVSATSIIPCPPDCYIVAYEYWYRMPLPWQLTQIDAGLSFFRNIDVKDLSNYVSFFTGSQFHPFFHQMELIHANQRADYRGLDEDPSVVINDTRALDTIKTDYRSMYIVSNKDIAVIMSRATFQDLTFENNLMPGYKNFVPGIGYGGLNIETNIDKFNENNSNSWYSPFTPDYYAKIGYSNQPQYNQAFFNVNPSGTMMQDPNEYLGGYAESRARALYFHCNYVQVNQPLPKNLKG